MKKTAVYICSGCKIGESINIDALMKSVSSDAEVNVCKEHSFLCSPKGVEIIKSDIENDKLSDIVICGCSPRVNTSVFSFGDDVLTERVNLREQVAWCHTPNDEDTQMLAEDNIKMGIARTLANQKVVPYIADNLSADILVVGAGISGITAAIEGAKAGYKIILTEKEENPGGWMNKLFKRLPGKSPYTKLEKPEINKYLDEINANKNITLLTKTEIKEISGEPGKFEAILKQNEKELNYKIGAIVTATGWKPYDATKLTEFSYGKFKNIITNIEMEELAKNGKINRPSDNKPVQSALFIQCAGSRDKDHLPYCSNFCCGTSLKQAKYIRDFNKDSSVFIVYKDIRTPGHYENFYKEIQNDDQIFLTKGDIENISEENDKLLVTVNNTLFNEQILIEVDLIVLATGMTPSNTEELNLNYRLGKGLPELKYDFPDSHFICFPYETRRTGIYAAGTVRAPMDISSSIEDARGATLKAIQTIESTKRGESVHPRAGDKSYPELSLERCTDCKRCTEECPFGAYDETEKGTPLPNPNRCRSCGICLGACPERIINFKDFSINGVSSMIKAIHIPDEFEEKPRILAFVCENDAYPAFDMAGIKHLKYSAFLRIIPVRCIGSVNNIWISDALSQGFDGILQIGCKPGDDYQCHYIHGSELTKTRGENYSETLDKMMLEPERLRTEFIEISEWHKIPEIIEDYIEVIEDIGANPFKEI